MSASDNVELHHIHLQEANFVRVSEVLKIQALQDQTSQNWVGAQHNKGFNQTYKFKESRRQPDAT